MSDAVSDEYSSYARRLGILLLFMCPIVYIGALVAVAIHEIMGHGLAALCLDGEFKGFILKWDGMGYAFVYPPVNAAKYHTIFVLSAGVVATTVAGFALLTLAFVQKKRFFTHMALLLLAIHCLLGGPPYVFWNAYHSTPPGDIARILALLESSSLRWFLMFVGALLTVAGIVVMNAMIFRAIEQWLGPDKRLHGVCRVIPLGLLFTGQAISWFIFDWNQIAQGIGQLPNIVGTALTLATLVVLYFCSLQVPVCERKVKEAILPIIIAWSLMALLLLSMWLWFSRGLIWS
jgi:hypothetical protein